MRRDADLSQVAVRKERTLMSPPPRAGGSQFIDAMIDDYAAAHSTPPDVTNSSLQRHG